jgi:hypothetical protein
MQRQHTKVIDFTNLNFPFKFILLVFKNKIYNYTTDVNYIWLQ